MRKISPFVRIDCISRLCRNLDSPSKPEERQRIRVVFLTDVTGVYDRAPRLPGATLIRRIDVLPDGKVHDFQLCECAWVNS